MIYTQKNTFKSYCEKSVWTILFALNCCVLLYMACHLFQIWTNKNFDIIKTFLLFDQEAEFKNIVFAKRQLWTAFTIETILYVFGGYFTYDYLIKVKNLRLNLIALFVLAFCIFAGESALLFFPAPDKAVEIQTCESIPVKKCRMNSKNCVPRYITWNKENHYCNLIELERQRMHEFLEQKAVKKRQALIELKKYEMERAKILAKREAEKEKTENNVPPVPVKDLSMQKPVVEEKVEDVVPVPVYTVPEEPKKVEEIPVVEPVAVQKPVVESVKEDAVEQTIEQPVEQPKPVKRKRRIRKKQIAPVSKIKQTPVVEEPLSAPTSLLKK